MQNSYIIHVYNFEIHHLQRIQIYHSFFKKKKKVSVRKSDDSVSKIEKILGDRMGTRTVWKNNKIFFL